MKDRWGVELGGEHLDLHDALEAWGGDSPVRVRRVSDIRGDSVVGLFADSLDILDAPSDVDAYAPSLVSRLNGLLFVEDQHRTPLSMGSVLENAPGATAPAAYRRHHVLRGAAGGRVRVRAKLSVGGDAASAPRTRGWLTESISDDAIGDVLTFLRGSPDWFDLYKAREIIHADVRERCGGDARKSVLPAWPSTAEDAWFGETSNLHRHGHISAPKPPRRGWMTIDAARAFLARRFVDWMHWRSHAKNRR